MENFTRNPQTIKINKEIVTVGDFINFAENKMNKSPLFFGHGTNNAFDEAVAMVEFALNQRNLTQSAKERKLSTNEKKQLIELVNQRIETQKPLGYLTNQAFFANLKFFVDENVIIPRSPIAEIIQNGFDFMNIPIHRVLDLCCGAGPIGLATAFYYPFKVTLSDISKKAIEITTYNHKKLSEKAIKHNHHLECEIIQSNLFKKIKGKFDLIISNPPYVSKTEYQSLAKEYFFEPKIALGAKKKGLAIVHRILKEAHYFLNDGGYLMMEVGASEDTLINYYPSDRFIWLEFQNGGSGVFIIAKQDLIDLNLRKKNKNA